MYQFFSVVVLYVTTANGHTQDVLYSQICGAAGVGKSVVSMVEGDRGSVLSREQEPNS